LNSLYNSNQLDSGAPRCHHRWVAIHNRIDLLASRFLAPLDIFVTDFSDLRYTELLARSIAMRILAVLFCAAFFFVEASRCQDEHQHELSAEELGSVHFSTSCSKTVSDNFNRAVALLHSFQYEQTRQTFLQVSEQDPNCAMAHWGIAMSHYHGLWGNGDTAAGRAALEKAKHAATANPTTTPRETAYIQALAGIYIEDDKSPAAHAQAFEQRMGALQAAYPEDEEAAIFHALALDITAPSRDKTFANQRKCGEILEPLFKLHPHHPGIAHYIIHCYDNPVLAEKGLAAARMYAEIAPASAHAQHMPSHLFTRVGQWDEAILSNVKSAQMAAEAEATSRDGEAREQRLHAMDYLVYAYLQSGRVKQAEAVLAEMNSFAPIAGNSFIGNYATAAIPARCAIELHDWKRAASLQVQTTGAPFVRAITCAAIGVGSARAGDLVRAGQAEHALVSLAESASIQNDSYSSNQMEVERREVAAWIAEKSGKSGEAIATMRSAAELEESMDKSGVTPGVVTPAREMLAELLALDKQPVAALVEYEAVLAAAPNRFNALYGAASAADAAGNSVSANFYYNKLSEIAVGDERPELVTARKRVGVSAEKNSATRP
jgi:tetratricopeptide (TPR) repeat protein